MKIGQKLIYLGGANLPFVNHQESILVGNRYTISEIYPKTKQYIRFCDNEIDACNRWWYETCYFKPMAVIPSNIRVL